MLRLAGLSRQGTNFAMAANEVRDPDAKRRIVRAAREEVGARGVRGATIRAIADRTGVSTGFVMHYFPDKQVLFEAVLAENNLLADQRVRAASSDQRGAKAIAATVRALLPIDEERRLEWKVWSAFWVETGSGDAGGEAAAARGLLDALTALVARLRVAFAEAKAGGELPGDLDPDFESERIVALAAGLGLLAGVGPTSHLHEHAERMIDAHLAELGHRSTTVAT
jgi:AcrR family transcriptional regulator